MKQCNNSSVFVNNQCDSKRLLHSSALTKSPGINRIYLNQITSIMSKGIQGDSIGRLWTLQEQKYQDVLQKSIPITWSHCQNAMMIWLYCHHAQNVNPQSGVALIKAHH
jgi:hypothetical protein